MLPWNVLVTTQPEGFEDAEAALRSLGRVERTRFFNVLVMEVEDTASFLDKLDAMTSVNPDLEERIISRVVPMEETFSFQTREGFRDEAGTRVRERAAELAGGSFHVRVERRGLEEVLDSQEEERHLGQVAMEALEAAGGSADVTFDDPDTVVAVETVSVRAGLAFLTRERRERHPYLRVD